MFRLVFQLALGKEVHWLVDGSMVLFGSQILQCPVRRNFDIYAATVGVKPGLVQEIA